MCVGVALLCHGAQSRRWLVHLIMVIQVKEEDSEAHAALHGRQPSDAHLEVLSYPQFIEVLGRVALQVKQCV